MDYPLVGLLGATSGQLSLSSPLGTWAMAVSLAASRGYSAHYSSGYLHAQPSPSDTWFVNHNLGQSFLSCVVYDVVGNQVDAEVTSVSENQVRVRFVIPVAGYARVQ